MSGFTSEQKEIVSSTIKKYFPLAEIFLFGSRRGQNFRKDSDLDVLIDTKEKNDFSKKGMLRSELEENTSLPFRVDLVFLDQIAPDFLALIRAGCEKW